MAKELESNLILKSFGIYCLLIVIVGTVNNLLAFYICLRKKLRKITTFVFFSFVFIADTLSLYLWCLNHFLESFYNTKSDQINIWSCRVLTFLQYVSLQWSSWLFVYFYLS